MRPTTATCGEPPLGAAIVRTIGSPSAKSAVNPRMDHGMSSRACQSPLELTHRGRALHERIERDLIEERAQVLADLTAEERRLVIESIARLSGAASARVSTEAGRCVRT